MGGYPQWRWHLDEAFVKINALLVGWDLISQRQRGAIQTGSGVTAPEILMLSGMGKGPNVTKARYLKIIT
jgi:hypothetical protein